MLNFVNNDLEIDLAEVVIDRKHRIGDPKKIRKKARPIIANFFRYYDRKKSFLQEETFKRKRFLITESLTSFGMKKLEKVPEKYGFKHIWTIDGRILFKNGNDKPSTYYGLLV